MHKTSCSHIKRVKLYTLAAILVKGLFFWRVFLNRKMSQREKCGELAIEQPLRSGRFVQAGYV